MEHNHDHEEGFLPESEIEKAFKGRLTAIGTTKKYSPQEWFKANNDHKLTIGHKERIGTSNFSCDKLTDEWFKWFLTTPVSENAMTNPTNAYGGRNAALMDKEGALVYFAAGSPFQEPFDFKRIVISKRAPLLVPAYNLVASVQEYPFVVSSAKDGTKELTGIVMKDLDGILGETVEASFDGQPFYGCAVVRKDLLRIANIPENNVLGIPQDRLQESGSTLDCVHGGLWMLISEKALTPGDHLLQFKVHSLNYQIQAKFLIKVLF